MPEPESSEAARPLDSAIARVLVDNHRELLRFVERRVGRRDLAEDILQEAFARGLPKLETLRDGEAVIAWFYRTLRNAIIDHHRRGQVADRALAQFAEEIESAQEPADAVREEVCRCVTRLAGTLKPDYARGAAARRGRRRLDDDLRRRARDHSRQRRSSGLPRARGAPPSGGRLVRLVRGARLSFVHLRPDAVAAAYGNRKRQ